MHLLDDGRTDDGNRQEHAGLTRDQRVLTLCLNKCHSTEKFLFDSRAAEIQRIVQPSVVSGSQSDIKEMHAIRNFHIQMRFCS